MLEIIIMLLGLAFPGNTLNTQSINQDQTEISQTANSTPEDTSGETTVPPKR